ncbi:MAG: LuxR C-terminal-related transcriptional regulator [Steroidobacteraceae bacterium]
MSGLELQEELNRRGAIAPVIFINGHGDIPMAVEAMQHGAFDFLQKPFRDQDLIDRIQKAIGERRGQPRSCFEKDRIRGRFESLTPREREVLALVTAGKANKAVMAGDLGVSQRTVEIHRARVMEKMEAASSPTSRMVLISNSWTRAIDQAQRRWRHARQVVGDPEDFRVAESAQWHAMRRRHARSAPAAASRNWRSRYPWCCPARPGITPSRLARPSAPWQPWQARK